MGRAENGRAYVRPLCHCRGAPDPRDNIPAKRACGPSQPGAKMVEAL